MSSACLPSKRTRGTLHPRAAIRQYACVSSVHVPWYTKIAISQTAGCLNLWHELEQAEKTSWLKRGRRRLHQHGRVDSDMKALPPNTRPTSSLCARPRVLRACAYVDSARLQDQNVAWVAMAKPRMLCLAFRGQPCEEILPSCHAEASSDHLLGAQYPINRGP